jgi:hypothetical protein
MSGLDVKRLTLPPQSETVGRLTGMGGREHALREMGGFGGAVREPDGGLFVVGI